MIQRLAASLAALCLWAPPAPCAAPSPGAHTEVSLDQALASALANNPTVHAQDSVIATAEAERGAGRARFLPLVRVEGNVMAWDSDLAISFTGDETSDLSQLPAPATPYEFVLSELLKGVSVPTVVRDQVTAELSVSVVQPLTALLSMGAVHELLDAGVTSAELERTRAVDKLTLQTATAWLRALQLKATLETLDAGLTQLDAQLVRVDSLIASGVAQYSDRLSLEVARAQLVQQRLKLESGLKMAHAGLAVSMGLAVDADIVPAPLPIATPPTLAADRRADIEYALAHRADMRSLQVGLERARLATSVEEDKYIPSLNAIANYRHTEGSSFSDSDAFFVGLFLKWDAWDWGATASGVDAAKARAARVAEMQRAVRAGVSLEIEQRRLGYETAVKALAVADQSIAQAEESVRLETARFESGAATVTDLIRAETALTGARASKDTAYFEALINRAQYLVAAGRPLTAQTLFEGGEAQ